MIWLTWRQHRTQALAGGIGLALIGVFLLLSHPGIAHTFNRLGLPGCFAAGRDCSNAADEFGRRYSGLQFLIPLFLVVPLGIGLFWGAPLVAREVEQGTHRLVWTQSVTRRRWLAAKIGLVAGGSVVGAAALAALVTWWSAMFVQAGDGRLIPGVFDIRGVVPIAYALFAVALGVLAGTVIRKTQAAMAATLVGFIGVRAAIALFVRRHYLPARTLISNLPVPGSKFGPAVRFGAGDWILGMNTVDRAGHVVTPGGGLDLNYLAPRCPGVVPSPGSLPPNGPLAACIRRLGLHTVTSYQPGSRFWAFQGIESAIFVALAAVLFGLAVVMVRRRIA